MHLAGLPLFLSHLWISWRSFGYSFMSKLSAVFLLSLFTLKSAGFWGIHDFKPEYRIRNRFNAAPCTGPDPAFPDCGSGIRIRISVLPEQLSAIEANARYLSHEQSGLLYLVGRLAYPDPDPQFEPGSATQINADPFTAVSEHETILDISFWGFGLPIWIRIRNLNAEPEPDSATQINTYPCRSVSETLPPPVTILHLKL